MTETPTDDAYRTVTLTRDETHFLESILYGVVGGDPRGPRRLVSGIMNKLAVWEPVKYKARIELLSERLGVHAVVVKEEYETEVQSKRRYEAFAGVIFGDVPPVPVQPRDGGDPGVPTDRQDATGAHLEPEGESGEV